MRGFGSTLAVAIMLAGGLQAQEAGGRYTIGSGYVATNDIFADGKDRWQTAALTSSIVRAPKWQGDLPDGVGELIEYRLQGRIIAPTDVENPPPGDRVYANTWSLGAHTHFDYNGAEVSLGADMVISGPQTGIYDIQRVAHEILNRDLPSQAVLDAGVQNGFHPGFVVEYARPFELSQDAEMRPFAEVRTGDETLFRSGVDFYFGTIGKHDLLVRDPVTGQRYRAVQGDIFEGFSFMLGGDVTAMQDSIYFPDTGPDMIDSRTRLRAGMVLQGQKNSLFYGVTYMSEEFEGQSEPQLVGSVRLNLEF